MLGCLIKSLQAAPSRKNREAFRPSDAFEEELNQFGLAKTSETKGWQSEADSSSELRMTGLATEQSRGSELLV